MKKILVFLFVGFLFSIQATNYKIQILLTNPRSVSTAFDRSMRERGDHKIYYEPWSAEICNHSFEELSKLTAEEVSKIRNYEKIKNLIFQDAKKKPIFIKEQIGAIKKEILEDNLLLSNPNVIFTILIRDPARSIESGFLMMADQVAPEMAIFFTEKMYCYDALVSFSEKHFNVRGKWPLIIEAEELCSKSAIILQQFCEHAGINYMEEALHWKPIAIPIDSWKNTKIHDQVMKSTGFFIHEEKGNSRFHKVEKKYIPALENIYQTQIKFYEKLKILKEKNYTRSTSNVEIFTRRRPDFASSVAGAEAAQLGICCAMQADAKEEPSRRSKISTFEVVSV